MRALYPFKKAASVVSIAFCIFFLLSACGKSSPGPFSESPWLKKLAGGKTFLMSCGLNNGGNIGSGYSFLYDSIIVINSSKILLYKAKDTLSLTDSASNTVLYENHKYVGSDYYSYSISIHKGSDTVYYSHSYYYGPPYLGGGTSCYGFSVTNPNSISNLDFTASNNLFIWDSIRFQSNAPSNSDFLWDFGDGVTSTLPDPVHVFNAYTANVTLIVNSSFVSKGWNLQTNLSKLTGSRNWKVTKYVYYMPSGVLDTTYNLPDSTFSISTGGNGLAVLGKNLGYCMAGFNGNEIDFCNAFPNESYFLRYYHAQNNFTLDYYFTDTAYKTNISYQSR